MVKKKDNEYNGTGSYDDATKRNNPTPVKEKSFDELLTETAAKITQKNYHQTEKIPFGDGVVTVHFRPPSHKVLTKMSKQYEDDRTSYLLSKTLYNPNEERFYTFDELKVLFDGLGGLTETIARMILDESGMNITLPAKNPIKKV